MYEVKSLYRWGSWKTSESEYAGIRVRQQRDFSTTVDLEDYTNKFITEALITRERTRQRQESLTAQELSMLRSVRGTASWRTQQMSPQFAADVSLLLSATAQPVVQDLLDANKLVRDMRRNAVQSLHFHSFNETPWQQLVFASWDDASDRHLSDKMLCDNSGYRKVVRTWSRRQCQRDGVAILQAPEENCWIEQRLDSSSCVC